jgi:hypothetical protein
MLASLLAQTTTDGWSVSPRPPAMWWRGCRKRLPSEPRPESAPQLCCKHPAEAQACGCGGFVLCPGGEREREARIAAVTCRCSHADPAWCGGGGGGEHQSLVITITRPAPLLRTQCGYSVQCRRPTVTRSAGRNYWGGLEYLTVTVSGRLVGGDEFI